ncbi:FxsB family cyclophane-forming radical SAM/SPASM peptide maturase [Phytohabitans kaempferiae]|uniref:FxsB family cyclophane-forming radical SAM/SPASM peptide maturase n=1 Tax=Phytohabitans kaempferiae TaxID=1620943 RepID=A0ABV6MDF7_9ACTN
MRHYVLKVHGRCDLACDHCYVYEHADQTWRTKPRAITPETVQAAAKRIAEHASTHGLAEVQVILHGGEPLLLGAAGLDAVLADLRAGIGPSARLDLRMQSNGVLLSTAICDVLLRHGVRVGISLDGDRAANDRHRRFASGASSHAQVRRALALLRRPRYRPIYAGILCTVDLANDPIGVYEALLAEDPPRIDLLLPHATWDHPPPRPPGDPTPYATWLARVHDRWSADGRPVPIRLFDSLTSTVLRGPSGTEAVGLDPADVVVIETDGTWEQADSLKTAYDGAARTGLDVFAHSVDEVAGHPGIAGRQSGLAGVCATCRACPVVERCGGGLFAHRHRSGSGFDNPSVYCADLKTLIERVDWKADSAKPDRILDDLGTGYGDAASLERLVAAQVPITRVLMALVGETEAGSFPWELLQRAESAAPESVAAVLAHPHVRTWAVSYLDGPDRDADRPHLASIAAAAAVLAGLSAEIEVPARGGRFHLPGLGAFGLGTPAAGTARLSISDGTFAVDGTAPEWLPAKRLDLGDQAVAIEDTDPYRDCYEWPVDGRAGDTAVASWQRLMTAAWQGIQRDAAEQATAVRLTLRTLVPLEVDVRGELRSASNRNAFGAVAVAPPGDGDALALLLVHEVQHVKLGALLDLYDLFDPTYAELLEVPWRPVPRPVEAVLQGAYAHLAVADVWRARALRPSAEAEAARAHFHRYRGWVTDAIERLRGTGALTAEGRRFTARMRETVESWRDPHG